MADATEQKPTGEVTPKPETKPELENQTVPYSRFAEVNTAKKELETKYNELVKAQETAAQKAAEEQAKKNGDYTTLLNQLKEKESGFAQKEVKLREKVAETVLTALAIKEGIANPKYINLFDGELDISDDLEVKNMKDVEDAFVKFKKENPTLFTPSKPVSKVDNKPVGSVKADASNLTPYEKMIRGMQEKQ
jgi:hypothetical protein